MASELAKNIFTNTMLLKSDWDNIDNKHLINSVRKSVSYTVFNDIITSNNGAALRPHQQELFTHVEKHLVNPYNLRIIYSTPTGSGKTFSSMLLQKQLLKRKRPTPLLIYSVPTKEILKRVGSDCEAHGINYWTAGKIGTDYFIRRPYSVRNSKENAGQQRGNMYYQLLLTIAQSIRFEDKIPGRCDVILADIEATAALLEVLRQPDDILNEVKLSSFGTADEKLKPSHKLILDEINGPDTRQKYTAWLRPENTILFLDEPNMGIHISPEVLNIVQRITQNFPHIAILASATLKNWDALPEWWKGHEPAACKYHTISSMAYSLPIAELSLITQTNTHKLSPFDLFNNHDDFVSYIAHLNDIAMGQLFRHFTKQQIEHIINAKLSTDDPAILNTIRQSTLKDALKTIDADTFNNYRNTWSNYKGYASPTLNANVSKTGITLIASYDPYKTARLLTQLDTEQSWNDAIHTVRKIIKHAQSRLKAQEREQAKAEKLRKKRDKDEDADPADADIPPIKCKFGKLELYADELDGITEESLVFLSKGIAISAPDADPGIKLQFQRAIYSKPDDISNVLPEIHILVVDYASIYGLDCPGVDKIILCNDIGNLLNPDDIIQFIGRLRRAGNATFMSFDNMVKILGNGDTYIPVSPIELLRTDIITGVSALKDKEQGVQLFKKLCKRVYNGVVFEQETVFKKMVYTIVNDFPEQEIKLYFTLLTKLAEALTITNMSEFLTSITERLDALQTTTLKVIFTFLYNYVNDTEEEYNLWYSNLKNTVYTGIESSTQCNVIVGDTVCTDNKSSAPNVNSTGTGLELSVSGIPLNHDVCEFGVEALQPVNITLIQKMMPIINWINSD